MEKKRKIAMVVRKSSFEEIEERDNQYYASLSETERLEVLMDLRSAIDPGIYRIAKIVSKKPLHEKEV